MFPFFSVPRICIYIITGLCHVVKLPLSIILYFLHVKMFFTCGKNDVFLAHLILLKESNRLVNILRPRRPPGPKKRKQNLEKNHVIAASVRSRLNLKEAV